MDAAGKPADSSMCPGFSPASRRRCNLQPCSNCTAAETCRGHGSCAQDGSCACSDGYSGFSCQVRDLTHIPHLLWCSSLKHGLPLRRKRLNKICLIPAHTPCRAGRTCSRGQGLQESEGC